MAEETSVNISGTFKDINACNVNISGTFKVVETIFANVAGIWKEVWNRITISVSATNATATDEDFAACGNVQSPNTVTTVVGGVSPFTYLWTRQSTADGNQFNISSATTKNPAWSATRCAVDNDNTETWKVVVTDDDSNTASHTMTVSLTWSDIT